ncbi:hypothetical protein NBRC110019_07390 [Neptunitalea chrysea]|uniref:Uncharacterized protein n=1 Tax=Neptunitalea chrysea TaxID=1647581 RepID=A0A9W6B3I6_9FLAO|nr:hypothetical protein [Neptunitalea chrysea]GLB51700.1 hypothetical protein NBRC110019_07390 [Neptunitalea chrysea]
MAITEEQLAAKFKAAFEFGSDDPNINVAEARQHLADELANGVAQFVIGRQTAVTGTSATGGAVTGTGTIQE